MKLEKSKRSFNKILELHFIKSKVYEPSIEKKKINKLYNTNFNKILISLKKALLIIFKYNKKNKQIMFIGAPKIIENIINTETIHLSVPTFLKIQNFNLNTYLIKGIKLKQKLLKEKKNFSSNLPIKPDLIVVFDKTSNQSIIKEGYLAKIPLIEFNINYKEHHPKYCYGIPGNISKTSNKFINDIFFIILNSMLKVLKINKK